MKPGREPKATLNDLLDRVLDRGLILSTDIIIQVAGIPLLGIQLKACLAGIQTMLDHGMWVNWDAALRLAATKELDRKKAAIALEETEEILLSTFSTMRNNSDSTEIYNPWRPGQLLLTNKRIILFRRNPLETLFDERHDTINSISLKVLEEGDHKKEIILVGFQLIKYMEFHTLDVPVREFMKVAQGIETLFDVIDAVNKVPNRG